MNPIRMALLLTALTPLGLGACGGSASTAPSNSSSVTGTWNGTYAWSSTATDTARLVLKEVNSLPSGAEITGIVTLSKSHTGTSSGGFLGSVGAAVRSSTSQVSLVATDPFGYTVFIMATINGNTLTGTIEGNGATFDGKPASVSFARQ